MPSHVSEDEAQRIADFCARVLSTLNMPRHELVLAAEPSDDGTFAMIYDTDDRFAALLKVCGDWEGLSDERKASTLTHEMLHLVHAELFQDATRILCDSGCLSQQMYNAFERVLKAHLERLVDRLTSVMVNGYDLKYPKRKKGKK